jgi:hypothetical protein
MKQLRILFLLILSVFVFSCSTPELDTSICISGDCNTNFWIDVQGHPGTYQDSEGVWHIKHAGLNYFFVKGQLTPLNPSEEINNVPNVVTCFDSNFFYLPGNITWTYPVYSYLGLWSSSQLNTPIPIGTQTYTFPQLANQSTIFNLAGYSIEPHLDWYGNQSVLQSYFSTKSRYNYTPKQGMVFFTDFIGQEATIYINTYFGDSPNPVVKELKIIFEP